MARPRAAGGRFDRPPDLQNPEFGGAVGSGIDLGRVQMLAGWQQLLVLRQGPSPWGSGR